MHVHVISLKLTNARLLSNFQTNPEAVLLFGCEKSRWVWVKETTGCVSRVVSSLDLCT